MDWITSDDAHFWDEGTHARSYRRLGAHPDERGAWFGVWAPHADSVSVIGGFNDWNAETHPLRRAGGGLWEGYVEGARPGHPYKYHIQNGHFQADKTDPYAFSLEKPTGHATEGLAARIKDLTSYDWQDGDWMASRKGPSGTGRPLSMYEVHLGSWRHKSHGESLSYREIAKPLADHVEELGFTHVELMPVMEHPYYGSWGYQVVGYYAPTFRYGEPEDFMYLVDYLHRRGIGVVLDWVPAHFATDPQGLVSFDGTPLFEQSDPLMRHHPDWGTYVFDYGKSGVQNFLVSNALFWLDRYHIDGLRFDAVASMLYRDYSRNEWTPNEHGGREHLEAIDFLKNVNESVYAEYPDALMIAEESTAWPGVTQPTYDDGLGFLYKWNMGWMHDTLAYAREDPVHRRYHHDDLTFPLVYAFSEQYALPFSHDEVVHGKGSLWGKMPGDPWQKAANLRLVYGHMVGHPGKKLLFMGSEFGQEREWSHDRQIDWHLLDDADNGALHEGVFEWTKDLFHLYREHPALWNDEPGGFEWIDHDDEAQSVICYLRKNEGRVLLFVMNATPVPRHNYRIGVPDAGAWTERLNSDAETYGGSGAGNLGAIEAEATPHHGRPASLALTLPPLSMLVLERQQQDGGPQTADGSSTTDE
jgi:1,4-alpha-glucan branching enzyme